jgi:NADH dehydrogenase [ubiquinone] 1 alpha subcomplex assembly factor 1
MKYLYLTLFMITSSQSQSIFNFTKTANISQWSVVNDGVMGGLSQGSFSLTSEGYGLFKGAVSLDNNGGFTSVRYRFTPLTTNKDSKIKLRLKGDGKEYQFRIKDNSRQYYSYITTFSTSGDWQDIEIPLGEMEPSFRGRKLNIPNFSENQIEEIVFLIANKKEERFELLLDSVVLE